MFEFRVPKSGTLIINKRYRACRIWDLIALDLVMSLLEFLRIGQMNVFGHRNCKKVMGEIALGVALLFNFQFSWAADECKNVFFADQKKPEIQISQFVVKTPIKIWDFKKDQYSSVPEFLQASLGEIESIFNSEEKLQAFDTKAVFAFDLSFSNKFELVSRGLSPEQHETLLNTISRKGVLKRLMRIPNRMRMKYIEVRRDPDSGEFLFAFKLPRELDIPFRSHARTHFAEVEREDLKFFRPKGQTGTQPDAQVNGVQIREDLMAMKHAQQTMATCSLAAGCRVLNARGHEADEWQLLEFALKLKSREDFFVGNDAGLSLNDFVRVLKLYQTMSEVSFQLELHEIHDPSLLELEAFRNQIRKAVQMGSGVDMIVNFWSPLIGRPGGGHFVPVGGYDPSNDMVLISETNLTSNSPYWISVQSLFQASISQESATRGYLIIHHEAANF